MKRWVGLSLLLFTMWSTGCAVSARYRYRDDYRYRYDRDHGRYDHRNNDYNYRR
jgi:hypothetical protein